MSLTNFLVKALRKPTEKAEEKGQISYRKWRKAWM
jgi:hypothetical protein